MGSSPTKHVEVRADLGTGFADASPSPSLSTATNGGDSVALAESDEAGWIACPRCLQLLEDPRQSPACRHPVCRACYRPGEECRACGEVSRLPAELLAPDEETARRVARWRDSMTSTSTATATARLPTSVNGEVNSSTDDSDSEEKVVNGDAAPVRRRQQEVALAVAVEGEATQRQQQPASPPSKASLAEAERILSSNGELLKRQLQRWADEDRRLDEFVADCHRAIDQEADRLRRDQRYRRLRAQQQSLETADALHKLRLGAARFRPGASGASPSAPLLALTAGGLHRRVEAARQGALAWNDEADDGDGDSKGEGEGEGGGGAEVERRLARLREFAAAAAANLTPSRLLPAASPATPSKARQRRSLLALTRGRRRQPTDATPVRELPGVHVWDVAIVRHTGSLCYRVDGGGGEGEGESDIRHCPAGGKWRPLPNPSLYCLLPASSRLLAVSPDGAALGEIRFSPRRARGNLERLRCLGDRLYASEPEFVYVTDLTGHCLHVLSGFSWAMGLWPDPARRRLLVVNGDRRCVEIFSLDSFSHEGSLYDDEFTDDLTGVCVVGSHLLVADHTAYRLHVYRADNLQPIKRLQVSAPRFLEADSSGAVYITGDQTDYHQITVLDPSSGRQFSCGFEGSKFGEFRSPSGLAVDEVAGEIYVCDFDNERVQVFALN